MLTLGQSIIRRADVLMLAGGLLCALVSLLPRRPPENGRPPENASGLYLVDREAEAGHVVMLGAMLLMVGVPELDLNDWWRGLFLVLAVFYAVRLVQHVRDALSGRTGSELRAGGAGYHLVASLAMAYSVASGGHDAHLHGVAPRPGGWALPWSWLAGLMALLFLADAIFTAIVLVTQRLPGSRDQVIPPGGRVAVVPHLIMDIAMVMML